MTDLTPTLRLIAAWDDAVAEGKLQNCLVAPGDDATGRWRSGDRVRLGLRVAMEAAEGPEFFAVNESLGRELPLATRRKVLSEIGFECCFSEYRLLKPGGNLRRLGRLPDIPGAVDQCRFHCQDPSHALSLLNREPLASVRLSSGTWNAYYNALPLEPRGHFLWVPARTNRGQEEPIETGVESTGGSRTGIVEQVVDPSAPIALPHFPQQLTTGWVDDLLELSAYYADQIVLFNSLHAGASVNHIHFQSLVQRERMVVEASPVTTYRGWQVLDDYLANAFVFSPQDRMTVGDCVARLQELDVPFNLVCFPKRLVVFPRNASQAIVREFPGDALAGLDFSGRCFIADPVSYEAADANRVVSAFRRTVLSLPQLESLGYFRMLDPK